MRYFISYSFTSKENQGFGSCDVTRKQKIHSSYDLKEISDIIKEENGFTGVVIMYWRPFEK